MKIMVDKLLGDASVSFYNKNNELIHTECFYGKADSQYIREIPVDPAEFSHSKCLFTSEFSYKVIS